MSALFIVRAVVEDVTTREAFERWYQEEHLPDALRAFGCTRAWRGWSPLEPEVHMAFYEFESVEAAMALPGSEALKSMVAEFDRIWGDRVRRTREIIPKQHELTA